MAGVFEQETNELYVNLHYVEGLHVRPAIIAAIESGDDGLFESLMEENCPVDVDDNFGWRPLHVAVDEGHLSMVQRLLQHEDVAIDSRNPEGQTALWLAALNGRLKICECLLENGAEPSIGNNDNKSPLHMAVRERHFNCVKLLVEFGANVNAVDMDGRTPIMDAAQLGLTSVVTLLFLSGADVGVADKLGITPLFAAAQSENRQCLLLMHKLCRHVGDANVDIEDIDGKTPLMMAAEHGRLTCVRYLLDKGADASHAAKDGALAILLATRNGHLDCVKALLPRTSRYALLKACYGNLVTTACNWLSLFLDRIRSNYIEYQGVYAFSEGVISVLHLAVEWNRVEILRYLLESGIHPDHYITQISHHKSHLAHCGHLYVAETALGLACYEGSVEMVTLLLDHGAQFSLGNNMVSNPLHSALRKRCPADFIHFLVGRGADINSQKNDDDGVPPVLCRALKYPHLLHELLVLGGRLKNWDHEVSGSVGHALAEMARDPWNGNDLLNVLWVLVHFAPRHQLRKLCSTLKLIRSDNPTGSLDGWNHLDEELASPQSLLQLCRLKTREVLMARRVFNLESLV